MITTTYPADPHSPLAVFPIRQFDEQESSSQTWKTGTPPSHRAWPILAAFIMFTRVTKSFFHALIENIAFVAAMSVMMIQRFKHCEFNVIDILPHT
jgi:hypothetical protein